MSNKDYDVSANKVAEVYDYLNKNGRIDKVDSCYQEKIRKELGLSRFVVYKALRFLEDYDMIERNRSGKKKIVSLA